MSKSNLIPQAHTLTVEELSKGGRNSAASRRKRKTLKEELLLILSEGDVQKQMSTALINEAIHGNKAGSVTRAFEVIRDTIGERCSDKVQIEAVGRDQSLQELKELFDDAETEPQERDYTNE